MVEGVYLKGDFFTLYPFRILIMNRDINDFILSTKNAIEEFTEAKLSLNNARDEYRKLLTRYVEIESKYRRYHGSNLLSGFCYFHNTDNFSIYSALYRTDSRKTTQLACYGDAKFNLRIEAILQKNFLELIKGNLFTIHPEEDSSIQQIIYIYPFSSNTGSKIIFTAVSSSIYFSNDKFCFLGEIFNNLLSNLIDLHYQPSFNYFERISSDIDKYLRSNIDNKHYVNAFLFKFNKLEDFFGHMGIPALLEASAKIITTLKNYFKEEDSKYFSLSLQEYIVLTKKSIDDEKIFDISNAEFEYIDISLPYITKILKLEKNSTIYDFWEDIFAFVNI